MEVMILMTVMVMTVMPMAVAMVLMVVCRSVNSRCNEYDDSSCEEGSSDDVYAAISNGNISNYYWMKKINERLLLKRTELLGLNGLNFNLKCRLKEIWRVNH